MVAVRSGGGQQVASGLIDELSHISMCDEVVAIVGESTFLNAHCKKRDIAFAPFLFDYLNRKFRFASGLCRIVSQFKSYVIYLLKRIRSFQMFRFCSDQFTKNSISRK